MDLKEKLDKIFWAYTDYLLYHGKGQIPYFINKLKYGKISGVYINTKFPFKVQAESMYTAATGRECTDLFKLTKHERKTLYDKHNEVLSIWYKARNTN